MCDGTWDISMIWRVKDGSIQIDQPLIMGIVNITPDSFSDGGLFLSPKNAVRHGLELVDAGADILDIGGESTRPGAETVAFDDELERVVPVIRGLRAKTDIPISVDTYKAGVALAAVRAGATIINDVSALRFDRDMVEVVAESGAGVVLMHMQGNPRDMQADPEYHDMTGEIMDFLGKQVEIALDGGVQAGQICVDPGIGFGKTLAHNLEIFRNMGRYLGLGYPLMIGPSRKSFIGKLLDDAPVEDRIEGTAAAVAASVLAGAHIIRVHDVKCMKRVARVAATLGSGRGGL